MVGKIPEVKVKLIFDSKAKAELKAITKEISDSFKHSPQLKDMIKSLDTLQIATHRLEVAMKSANIGGGKGSGGNFVGGMEAKSYFKELLKTLEDAKNQDQRDLFGSLERKLADVAKTIAIAVGKVGGKGGSTTTVKQGLTFDEQMSLKEQAGQNELLAIAAKKDWHVKIADKKTEREREQEQGRVSRQANRGWVSMMGGSGSIFGQLTKVLEPVMKDAFKPLQQITEYEKFTKTKEGQEAENMRYMKGANPLAKMEGLKMFQDAGIDDPDSARKSSGGRFGRMKSWMGGRSKAYEEGGIGGMLGGAKGMAMLGGAMAGVALIKKGVGLAIESSPMMQQMLKLWKFGIMMVFRPLGDFFGFFLRPIFIYLLRKFIIPFYQDYLPLMQQLGMDLGETVVGILETIAMGMGYLKRPAREDVSADVEPAEEGTTQWAKNQADAWQEAMAESMSVNAAYWEKMFPDGLPQWALDKLSGNFVNPKEDPNSPFYQEGWEQADSQNLGTGAENTGSGNQLAGVQGGVATNYDRPDLIKPEGQDSLRTALGTGGTVEVLGEDIKNLDTAVEKNTSSLDMSLGLGQPAWADPEPKVEINVVVNASGAGTEEVQKAVVEEVAKIPDIVIPKVTGYIQKNFSRVRG